MAIHRRVGEAWGIALTLTDQGFVYMLQNKFDEAVTTLAQGQRIAQTIQAERALADIYRHFALIACRRGEQDKAKALIREALLIRQKVSTPRYLIEELETMLLIVVEQGDLYACLVLASAVKVARQVLQLVTPPVEMKLIDDAVARARHQLPTTLAATAWAAGEAMTLDQAVAYALAT